MGLKVETDSQVPVPHVHMPCGCIYIGKGEYLLKCRRESHKMPGYFDGAEHLMRRYQEEHR